MRIRCMLSLLAVFVLVMTVANGCVSDDRNDNIDASEEVVRIRVAHGASESYHMHLAWLKFKEILERDDRFKVEVYPASQMGNDYEMIESVKTGDITMASPPSSFLVDESPGMAMIELPYVFSSRQEAVAVLGSLWGSERLKDLEEHGMYGLGYLENGLRHLTNSKVAVRTPEDLKGLKLRTMQVPAHVYLWNDMGATAEGAPFAELYTNLSNGVFDGQENPVSHIYSQKFYEVQDYITLTGHVYTAYVPVVNVDFWRGLDETMQNAIKEAFDTAKDYQLGMIEAEERRQLDEIVNHEIYPTTLIELTPDERKLLLMVPSRRWFITEK